MPPVLAREELYRNERTVVTREVGDSGVAVVRKLALGTEALKRLRHERGILQRLAGVAGVVQLSAQPAPVDALLLQDVPGPTLAERVAAQPLSVVDTLLLAARLCQTLAAVHRAGIVHKDINPSNIVLVGPDASPLLIDFNIASSAVQEHLGFTHQSQIAGTLAYMAPEQTGRTGRPVDLRADLYALGVMLYELLVGHKPFESKDLLELVHDHLVCVPTPPDELRLGLPVSLSALVMRLLEKEPDRRYQSAEGLRHDLLRILQAVQADPHGPWPAVPLGQRDFPLRLSPPSRLVGRDPELAALRRALDDASVGRGGLMLISGAPGVGKSALVNELRPLVTARHGWYISGKFDQYRQDTPTAAVQALRALGSLLLAEPEAALCDHRERIRAALGNNLGVGPALLPEFALLLGPQPKVVINDPMEAEQRILQSSVDLLGAIASKAHPVVMVFDDLQWAPAISLRFLDAVLTRNPPVPGLLVVGAYRDGEVDAAHPLTALMARWRQLGMVPPYLSLHNLPAHDLGELIGEMLRLPPIEAERLGLALAERTDGNPYDTVELVNALRADELLTPDEGGWRWDPAALHRYMGHCNVLQLLAQRIDKLPPPAREVLEVMACLGGEVKRGLLALALDCSDDALTPRTEAAINDGLLLIEQGHHSLLRFRHDRVQQSVFEHMTEGHRSALHLRLARRLGTQRELAALAAEQYLPAADALRDAEECRHVIDLFHTAAIRSRGLNHAVAERFLAAALGLLARLPAPHDEALRHSLAVKHHAALYGLARFDEADATYAALAAACPDPMQLVDAAGVQMYSLNSRARQADAVALGMALLGRMGVVQPDNLQAAVGAGFQRLGGWVAALADNQDRTRPEVTDPVFVARSQLMLRTATAAFFSDQTLYAWLTLESHRLWIEVGPCAPLMAGVRALPMLLAGILQNHRGAYVCAQHLMSVSAARGYTTAHSLAHFTASVCATHWFEPAESALAQVQKAFDGLMQAGELQYACFCFTIALQVMLDSEDNLEGFEAKLETAKAFATRTGNAHSLSTMAMYKQMVAALRGQTDAPGSLHGPGYDEAAYEAEVANPPTLFTGMFHAVRATTALVFGDMPRVVRHGAAGTAGLPRMPGMYDTAKVHLMKALSLTETLRTSLPDAHPALLTELATERDWLARRAVDAPSNFAHLVPWVDAERERALGRFWHAGMAYEEAMQAARVSQRLWHRALITERAALFHLEHDMPHTARPLLVEACQLYERWGASGKVEQMKRAHVFLRHGRGLAQAGASSHSTIVSADMVDLMAVLRASQALSSETNLRALIARLSKVLGAMTGAHTVQLLVRADEQSPWVVHTAQGDVLNELPIADAVTRRVLALSPVRYAERTRLPLLLDDALSDDRFAADAALEGMSQCAMLLVPIVQQGELRAMLVLSNPHRRQAFGSDSLDAIGLIAGQLAVSLDNALLYASLAHKVAERTAALEEANRQLEALSLTDALTALPNRRRFDTALRAEWLRARRTGKPLSIVMIDIDFFKLYNDYYGHQGGDECLQDVAQALATGRRGGSDLVARYGGEEFVMLLPDTDADGASALAERVRAAVADLRRAHAKSPLGQVSVSLGVATCIVRPDVEPATLVERADQALYEAKHTGRNRVLQAPACA